MLKSKFGRILLCSMWSLWGWSSVDAATPLPTIAVTEPASRAVETSDYAVTLRGSATTANGLVSLSWVNQFGQRGHGTWVENPQRAAVWQVPNLPLRPGVNLIAVTAVDAANRSSTLHLVVNRKPVAGETAASPVQTGVLENRPIVYQLWNGHAVVEGDILVNPAAFSRPNTSGTGADRSVSTDGISISETAGLWPKVTGVYEIPYVITGTSDNLSAAISYFNLTFKGFMQLVTYTNQANYVNIIVDGGGSGEGHSWVGMMGGEQTLYCGTGCTEATWLHELGHTVGLLHEHQRPDRAKYIKLMLTNADQPNVPGNFTLFSFDYQTEGLYDYASVMHYGAFNFSYSGLPVLESIPAGIPLSNDSGYSAGDIDSIHRLYGATPSAVTITTNPAGLSIIVDGTTYTAPQSFNFALNSTHTLSVPADPQFTTPADGSTYAFGNWNDLGASTHMITIAPGNGSLVAPAKEPAVTMYEANFVRLQPFAYLNPPVYPAGAGTVVATPAPTAEFGGEFYVDRTLVKLTLTANAGYSFYDWFNLPYPASSNPHSFYIQAPYTQSQAVMEPDATPVTIVGETLTGPNTWNPGLVGYVDTQFTLLPAGFTSVYNTGWGAGTSHTVSVDQTQSPVTTNVYYNWNAWSDKGAITHTIKQQATGGKTISASFTPFYASYTVPPPLGSSGAACAGGVATSPPGVSYPVNTAFLFYQDGTSVTTTATPNPVFPAMGFADWSSGLTGSVNPQTTTLHGQFVPTANFNVIASPLALTSIAPALEAKSATAAPVLTIKGSGFTPTDTYTYWNGSYRSNTYVSGTEITMQLQAGDLANAGGQQVFVGNYTTNASSQTCGVGAQIGVTVK